MFSGMAASLLEFSPGAGELGLALYDSSHVLLADSISPGNWQAIVLRVSGGNTYYLRVWGREGAVNPWYNLEVEIYLPSGPDAFEPNHSFEMATDLGSLGGIVLEELSIHDYFNDDYFRFTAATSGTIAARISFSNAVGDLDMVLYDSDYNQLQYASSGTDEEIITYDVIGQETYYLRVLGSWGAINWYDLRVWMMLEPDRLEPNDSFTAATDLGTINAVGLEGLNIHEPYNQDYFRFVPAVSGTLTARIDFSHAAGDLDMGIYDDGRLVLAISQSVEDFESIVWPVVAGQTYYLRVWGFAGAMNPAYDLTLTVSSDWLLTGTPGADAYYMRLAPDGQTIQVWESAAPVGQPQHSLDRLLLPTFTIEGLGGDDVLTIDFSAGSPIPAAGLVFNAGLPGSAGGRLVILGSAGADLVSINGNSATINGSTVLLAGVGRIDLDAAGGQDSISISGNIPVLLTASQDLAALNLQQDARLALPPGASQVLLTRALTLDPGATLDLADNDLVVRVDEQVQLAMLAMLRSAIAAGRSGGSWLGNGITSSAARDNDITGLMLALNAAGGAMLLPSLQGIPLQPADIIARYTWNGDFNLDGRVGPEDYFRLDLAFLTGAPLIADVDLDGQLNGDDYYLIDQAFLFQTAAPLAASSPISAEAAPAVQPAPAAPAAQPAPAPPLPGIAFSPAPIQRWRMPGVFNSAETIERASAPAYTLLHDRDLFGMELQSKPPADCR
jgi:hypothetical protein